MTEQQSTLADQAMQAVRKMALARQFSEDETNDAISTAWEFAQLGKGYPKSIAWYAIKRVRSVRRFHESVRSIDSMKQLPGKPTRSGFDSCDVGRPGSDPAKLAALRIDYSEWLQSLPDRPRQIAEALASGEATGELAKTLGCSPARISQIRRELEAHWIEFQT